VFIQQVLYLISITAVFPNTKCNMIELRCHPIVLGQLVHKERFTTVYDLPIYAPKPI